MAGFCTRFSLAFLLVLNQIKAQIDISVTIPGEGAGEELGYGGDVGWQESPSEVPASPAGYQFYTYYTRQTNNIRQPPVRPPLRQFRWNSYRVNYGGGRTNQPRVPTSGGGMLKYRQPFQNMKKFIWWTSPPQQPDVQTNALPYSGGFGLGVTHMKKLLDDHNTVRASLRAANMYKLKWSNQLAQEAHAWIQHCEMRHQQRGRGENLAMVYGYGVNVNTLVNTAVSGWYNERHNWRYGDGFSPSTGHYTQMIWCSSKAMGCAAKQCPDKLLLACFYSPQGNIMGQLPFQPGPPCSQCIPNTMCQANLCLW